MTTQYYGHLKVHFDEAKKREEELISKGYFAEVVTRENKYGVRVYAVRFKKK